MWARCRNPETWCCCTASPSLHPESLNKISGYSAPGFSPKIRYSDLQLQQRLGTISWLQLFPDPDLEHNPARNQRSFLTSVSFSIFLTVQNSDHFNLIWIRMVGSNICSRIRVPWRICKGTGYNGNSSTNRQICKYNDNPTTGRPLIFNFFFSRLP